MKNAEEVAREVYLSCKETDFEPVYTREMFAAALKDYAEERVREAQAVGHRHKYLMATNEARAIGFREGVEKAAKAVYEGGVNLNPYHERRDAIARVRALLPISAEKEKP